MKISGPRRCKFTVQFEVDLDRCPGWGDKPSDWITLATQMFLQQSHYNAKATTISVKINDEVIK